MKKIKLQYFVITFLVLAGNCFSLASYAFNQNPSDSPTALLKLENKHENNSGGKKEVTLDDYLNTRKKQIKVLKKLLDQIPVDSQKIVDKKMNQSGRKQK